MINKKNNYNKFFIVNRKMTYDPENYEHLYKIIIIGDSGVGKSNILRRYLHNEFKHDTKSTIGVEFGSKQIKVNNVNIKLQIWDTAGEERYRSITSAYYKGSKGCFIVYDITSIQTFENVEKWYEEILKSAEKNISIILVGNKCDLVNERKVTIEMGEEKAKNLNCPFFETSALNNTHIETVFQTISETIYNKSKNEKNLDDEDDDYEIVKDDKNININTDKKPEKKCC